MVARKRRVLWFPVGPYDFDLSTRGPFLTPFIDDTNRAAHLFRVLCKLARNPGCVNVRAFQIDEMSPMVVYEHAGRIRDVKEIAFHPKTLQPTDIEKPIPG
jgi:hypothetical protein